MVYLTKKQHAFVGSFAEASQAVRSYIESEDLGSTEWYRRGGQGKVYATSNLLKQIAHVSYNGRVWEGIDTFKPGQTEIKDLDRSSL
jgi:hypothetical protein